MDSQQLLDIADRCVKCGLCLPRCPTYQLTRDEGESPRGRISLIQGVLTGALQQEQTSTHLDHCLLCRRCEGACPSGVPYGELLEEFRRKSAKTPPDISVRLASQPIMQPALWLYQHSGLQKLGEQVTTGRLRRLQQMLPRMGTPWTPTGDYPAKGQARGRVGLLSGCVGRVADQNAITAACRLLQHLGREVVIPAEQGCCGALAYHAGDRATARIQMQHNQQLFADLDVEAWIGLASGCLAHMNDGSRPGSDQQPPALELCQYLERQGELEYASFCQANKTTWLHLPCSLEQLPGARESTRRLLARIPGLQLHELTGFGCCGSAGSYMLNQPEMAERLRKPMIEQIREQLPAGEKGIVLTSNTGCAMHLRQGLRAEKLDIEVLHPVELLWQQLVKDNS